MKIFVVDWQIFPFEVLVCLNATKDQIEKRIKKTGYKMDQEEKDALVMHGRGRTVMLKGGQTILWINYMPKKGSCVLAHEIFHAVCFLLNRIELPINSMTEELPGYMIEYLTYQITKKL